MAAEVLSDISSALATTFAPQLVRAWNRSSETLSRITVMPGAGQGGGKQVGWDVQFSTSGAAADTFAEGADVAAGELLHDQEKPATLAWGQYRSAFQLSNLELNAAYANMGNADELARLLDERFFDSIAAITSKINKDVISGTGTGTGGNPTIVGLIAALAATGTYANINKATFTEWAGNVSANGGTLRALTLDLLAKAEQAAFVASGSSQEVLLASAGVRTKYEGLFNAVQRLVTSGGPIPRMDGSSEDLYWRGKPIVRDKDMPAGTLIGARLSAVELRVLPWAPMPANWIPSTVRELVSTNGDMQKSLGAFLHVYPLAVTGSAVKFCAEIYCQIKVKRTNEHFLVQDISEV